MSAESQDTAGDATPTADGDTPDSEFKDVIRHLVSQMNQLQDDVEAYQEEIDALRADLRTERSQRKALEEELEAETDSLQETIEHQIGERVSAIQDVREEIADIEEAVSDEHETRARSEAKLRKRVNYVAAEAGVDIDDAALHSDDKLVRLVKNGPADVTDRVRANTERACDLLREIDNRQFARLTSVDEGRVAVFKSTDVKPLLEERYGKDFASSQIARVFEKVEDLGGDSPRRVVHDKTSAKTDHGEKQIHRLRIWNPEQIIVAAEGES